MKKLVGVFLTLAASIALGTAANAAIKSTGPVFTFGQDNAVCQITTVAPTAGNVTLRIINESSVIVGSFVCGPMATNGYCRAVAGGLAAVGHWCTATGTATDVNRIRGNMDIRLVNTQATAIEIPLR